MLGESGAWQAHSLWCFSSSVFLLGGMFHSMVLISIAAAIGLVSYVLCTRSSVRHAKQGKRVMLAHSDLGT